MHIRCWLLAAVAASCCGCGESLVQSVIQRRIDGVWAGANAKAQVENAAERALLPYLKNALTGRKVYEVCPVFFCWDVRIQDVTDLRINLGNRGPSVTVLSEPEAQWWGDDDYDYIAFSFEANWPAGNGASVSFELALGPVAPDYTVRVDNMTFWCAGSALVRVPKGPSGSTQVVLTLTDVQFEMRAVAESWFWSVGIGGTVRSLLDRILVRQVLGRMIALAWGESL